MEGTEEIEKNRATTQVSLIPPERIFFYLYQASFSRHNRRHGNSALQEQLYVYTLTRELWHHLLVMLDIYVEALSVVR
jgi:hypothetical protein